MFKSIKEVLKTMGEGLAFEFSSELHHEKRKSEILDSQDSASTTAKDTSKSRSVQTNEEEISSDTNECTSAFLPV